MRALAPTFSAPSRRPHSSSSTHEAPFLAPEPQRQGGNITPALRIRRSKERLPLVSSFRRTGSRKSTLASLSSKSSNPLTAGMDPVLASRLREFGQQHLVSHWESIPEAEQRAQLAGQLEDLDLERVTKIFRSSVQAAPSDGNDGAIEPVREEVCSVAGRSREQEDTWRNGGLKAIAQGKLAVLLLAGGQGTRLGSSDPKGCYNIGLPSQKSLFQLQAERLLKVQELSRLAEAGAGAGDTTPVIPWYIMTSPFTHDATVAFFQAHNYFGLSPDQVKLFEQGTMPCFTMGGQLILESTAKLATAPDGNGGVYLALKASGCLADMKRRGVEMVECFSVDNALVRVADPVFLGFCLQTRSPCAAKVVQKALPQGTAPYVSLVLLLRGAPQAYPEERVGVFARKRRAGSRPESGNEKGGGEGGRGGGGGGGAGRWTVQVVEYSEIPRHLATSLDPGSGELLFNWSNICMHMFTVPFLEGVTAELEEQSLFHVAKKSIPSLGGSLKGIKLEQFIFDVFPLASDVALFEVKRHEEFSPVKNAPGTPTDSPDTARAHILRLHAQWVTQAGGHVEGAGGEETVGVEVAPSMSYAGEGLESCKRRSFISGTQVR